MTGIPQPTVLQVRGLSKRYGDHAVLQDIDLELRAGQFVAIVGDSGVGKSTLLNCMAGLDRWDTGEVLLCGHNLEQASEEARAMLRRQHVGFVFQAFHVLPHLDVQQNVALPLMLLGRREPQRVQAMLTAVGLDGLAMRLPQQLSGGQLQRVAIARALVHAPRVLLADEPTGNLDPRTAAQVMQALIDQTRKEGSALVLVTHSEQAAARADRVLRLTAHGLEPK